MPARASHLCRDSNRSLSHQLALVPTLFLTLMVFFFSSPESASAAKLKEDEVHRLLEAYTRKHPASVVAVKVIQPSGDLFLSSGEFLPVEDASTQADGESGNRALENLVVTGSPEQINAKGTSGKATRSPDEHSVFAIGSVTKTFAAALLALLAEKNRLTLDTAASDYLPPTWRIPTENTAGTERRITLFELATHTSGLPVQPPDIVSFARSHHTENDPYSLYDRHALEQSLASVKLRQPIGEKYLYSNLGFGLLGHALAKAADAPTFESALRTHLLEPLELRETTFNLTPQMKLRRVPTFDRQGISAPTWSFATLEACGGLHSTIHDMTRWVKAHWLPPLDEDVKLNNATLPHQPQPSKAISLALANTLRRHFPKDANHATKEPQMGLGWHWIAISLPPNAHSSDEKKDVSPIVKRIPFHNGATTASRSFVALDTEHRVGVILLANVPHSLDELGVTLMQRLLSND